MPEVSLVAEAPHGFRHCEDGGYVRVQTSARTVLTVATTHAVSQHLSSSTETTSTQASSRYGMTEADEEAALRAPVPELGTEATARPVGEEAEEAGREKAAATMQAAMRGSARAWRQLSARASSSSPGYSRAVSAHDEVVLGSGLLGNSFPDAPPTPHQPSIDLGQILSSGATMTNVFASASPSFARAVSGHGGVAPTRSEVEAATALRSRLDAATATEAAEAAIAAKAAIVAEAAAAAVHPTADKAVAQPADHKAWLRPTADELATLLAAGLEPRKGVPGLFLCRDDDEWPIVPPDPIKLEGQAQERADAMRDELATHLREKGIEGLPKKNLNGKEGADLMGAWLQEANLFGAQLQGANLRRVQLQKADLRRAQLQRADLHGAQLQKANLWKSHLQGAKLQGGKLQGAIFSGAQLQKASFLRARLAGANLNHSKLSGADFTSADLTKANLNGALESMRNYRPPGPPAALASSSWRSKSVAKSAAVAVYKKLADDDDDDDDDADGDSSGSEEEDDDENEATLAPWLKAAEEVAAQAAGTLVAVAQPVLLVVNSAVAELGRLCDALSERVPKALVRSLLPLLEKQSDLPAAQLQKLVATRLKGLLNTCVLDPIFDKALPGAIRAVKTQIEQVQRWAKEEKALNPQAMVKELEHELCTLTSQLCEQQQQLFETFSEGCSPPARAPVATAPVATGQMQRLGTFEELAYSPPPSGEDELNEVEMIGQLRDLAGEIICAITQMLADDLKAGLARLKKRAKEKLDAFAERAAVPISALLEGAKSLEAIQLAKQLPEVQGYIEALKKELCEDVLRKRITMGLMGAASKPLRGIGHGAEQTLALSIKFEECLTKKLNKVDEAAQKLLRRHLPQGSLRARAIEVMLKTATKYEVRVGGFNGSVDMLWMAWKRSRVELNTDENQLVYLSDELKKLKDKESTELNWRDAAEGWISVLELRGQLRVECGQAVLQCMVADKKVLEALGAAKAMMHIEGDTPPAALVAIIAQGPGAHIRKHGYRYTRRIDKELVLIRRVKELQTRAVASFGTLLVATSITVGNYLARVMYDGVNNGFGSQSWLTWVLPFAVLLGIIVLCCFGLAAYSCCKRDRCWMRPLRARTVPRA